jgi:hypothetical protein
MYIYIHILHHTVYIYMPKTRIALSIARNKTAEHQTSHLGTPCLGVLLGTVHTAKSNMVS